MSRHSPARALSEFGRVDILINNAAIRPHKPFTETTDADWELIRSVILDGPLYLTRALIEPMVREYGRILFFVGDRSISARGSGRTHLSAAKMGLIGMARGLASEFLAAVATTGFFIGSIFTLWTIPIGAVPLFITLTGWFWPKANESSSEPQAAPARSTR